MTALLRALSRFFSPDTARANAEAATAELLNRRLEQLEAEAYVAELTARAPQASGIR